MPRSIASLVLLAGLLAACGDDPVPTLPVEVEGPGYRGVILPASAWPSFGYEVDGCWAVDAEDVRRAEAALPAAARQFAPELEVPLDRYVRQYVGVILEGERRLYLNLLHQEAVRPTADDDPQDLDRWKRELYVVNDGGNWFVEAFFDPEKSEFTELWVHGEA